jgi:ABC-type multidrug transport system permease subunit
MSKIFEIIKKNIRLLVKSKGSALIVVLGPLLLIFLAGLAFNNSNVYRVNVGVYSPSYTEDINSFLGKLSSSQFRTLKFDSEQKCVDSIRQGVSHTCIVFPEGFKVSGNETSRVTFYVDYSKINMVWMVRDTLFSKISERATEISTTLAGTLLQKIDDTLSEINSRKSTLSELSSSAGKSGQDLVSIKSQLSAVDLSMDKKSFNLEFLKARMIALNDAGKDAINTSRTALNEIKSEANSSSIDEIIDSALSDLLKIENTLSNSSSNSSEINTLVLAFDRKLDETKAKFDSASAARANVSRQIDAIKLSMDNDIKKIALLQSSFNSISGNLEGVASQDASVIANPVSTLIKPVTTKSYLGYMFPILIAMLTMFVSVVFSTTIVITEKRSSAHFRNLITPTTEDLFLFGAYLTNMVLSSIQIVIMLLISIIFFKAQIIRMLPGVLVILLFTATFFTLLGILIGNLFHSEETATLGAISICSVLLLMSSVVLPLESMPSYFMNLAKFNPFVISELLLRRAVIFETPLYQIGYEFFLLVAYSVIMLAVLFAIIHFRSRFGIKRTGFRKGRRKEKDISALIVIKEKEDSADKSEKSEKPEKKRTNLSNAGTLSALIELLEQMDSEEFSHHTKEEFASWVRLNIKEEDLAKKILATESKKELEREFKSAYDKHLKKIEELKKKIAEKKRKLERKK